MEQIRPGDRVKVINGSDSGGNLIVGQEWTVDQVKLDRRGEPNILGFDTPDGHMAWNICRFEKIDTWTWGDIEPGDKITFTFKGESFKATAYPMYSGVGLLGFTVRDTSGSVYAKPTDLAVVDIEKKNMKLPTTIGSRVRAGDHEYILLDTAVTPVATWSGAVPSSPIWVVTKGKFAWTDGSYLRRLRYTVLHDAGKDVHNG